MEGPRPTVRTAPSGAEDHPPESFPSARTAAGSRREEGRGGPAQVSPGRLPVPIGIAGRQAESGARLESARWVQGQAGQPRRRESRVGKEARARPGGPGCHVARLEAARRRPGRRREARAALAASSRGRESAGRERCPRAVAGWHGLCSPSSRPGS